MHITSFWDEADFSLPPVAAATSIFPRRPFLEAWWHHFGSGELHLVGNGSALLALEHGAGGTVRFLGDEDLTDYHSPLGSGSGPLLARYLASLAEGIAFRFDSLPAEAADELEPYLPPSTSRARYEAAFRLTLPATFDEWLAGLKKKERQELRRKHRRFTEALGTPQFVHSDDPIGAFIDLHRMSPGPKGRFMTPDREAFFRDLAGLEEARVDVVAGSDGAPVAATLGFVGDGGYALYNSAYHPDHASSSPGMVILWLLIERTIQAGLAGFDFLKGDEAYKLRLGAAARPLYVLEGRT